MREREITNSKTGRGKAGDRKRQRHKEYDLTLDFWVADDGADLLQGL